mmetsp:Transcript_10473/g.12316  ORF Transcript_10473/g.12316 Transcript_10473/m.12316 type:complete len:807 (-) Transcript_10473:41-2461(-)
MTTTIKGMMNPSSNKIIRKVQSMDCVLPSVQIKGEWVYPNNSPKKKASRFSCTSNRNSEMSSVRKRSDCRTTISCTAHILETSTSTNDNNNNNNNSGGSTIRTRSTSSTSLTGLEVVAEQRTNHEGMLFFHGEQQRYSLPYGTLVIVLLFLASISSYNNESQSSSKTSFLFHSVSSQNKNPADGGGGGGGNNKINNNRLGSAMIESVTEVFSPILPFTGGLDLRRDGNWRRWRNWFGLVTPSSADSNNSIQSQTISLFPRGGKRDTTTATTNTNNQDPITLNTNTVEQPTYAITLSTNDPFLSTDKISEMTLNEIAFVFRYVIESGRNNFHSKRFLSQPLEGVPLRQQVIDTMQAIDDAAAKSRGWNVYPADTSDIQFDLTTTEPNANHPAPLSPKIGYGDVDALQFCAAMRLFAEWRILRQIPPGYKAYAVGMNLGHKDIVQNVAKIEKAAHEWIQLKGSSAAAANYDTNRECGANSTSRASTDTVRRSPTLRQLLVHEINMDTHTTNKLPRLKDGTAAMGLLWVRRQLHYQTVIFRNVISVPEVYPSAIKAVGAAYSEVYNGVHGWAVQKIFNYSFQAAPDAEEIFLHMNPEELARIRIAAAAVEEGCDDEHDGVGDDVSVQNDLGSGEEEDELDDTHHPLLDANANVSSQGKEDVNLSTNKDNNPFAKLGSHIASEWDKLGSHVTSEWDKLGQHIEGEFEKFTCGIGKVFNHKNSKEDCDEERQPVKADSKTRQGPQQQQQPPQNRQNNRPALTGELLDKFINERMTLDARRQIATYLLVAQPLLADLAGLFAEMNMDDPTKV